MEMDQLAQFAMAIVFIASIGGVGLIVLGALYNSTSDATAQGIITSSKTAIGNLGAQLGTIGTVTGVVFLLAIVIMALSSLGQGASV